MGRQRLPPGTTSEDGLPTTWKHPAERPADGCPAGWYRSRFVWSLTPYMRMRVEGGQRVSNPLLERCEDELVVQLILHLELEQERFENWRAEQTRG